jgi:hypothetical protein
MGAGATSQRLVLAWRLAEPRPHVWDRSYVAKLEQAAGAFPRRPLIVLAFAPAWANPDSASFCPADSDCLFPPATSELPEWASFVRRAASAFPRADFEIWNEPNLRGFWQPGVDPEAYLELVRVAWRAIQGERSAGRSGARVVVGALAQVPNAGEDSQTPWDFLERLFDHGLRGNYDALSWHAYPYQSEGGVESLSGGSAFARDWEEMREVVDRHDPAARFWITETGVTTSGTAGVSEAEQADRLAAVTRKLLDMADVAAVYVHTLFDRAVYPPGDRERGFGVIRAPGPGRRAGKPAYGALARSVRAGGGGRAQ